MSYKEAIQELDSLMPLAEFAVTNLRVVQTALNEKVVSAAEGGEHCSPSASICVTCMTR